MLLVSGRARTCARACSSSPSYKSCIWTPIYQSYLSSTGCEMPVAAVTAMGAVVDAHVSKAGSHVITVFHLVRVSAAIYLPLPSRETIIHHWHHHLPWTPNNIYRMPHMPRRPSWSENKILTLSTMTPPSLMNLKFASRLS